MRKIFLIVWFFVLLAAVAFHYGPGQEKMARDEIASMVEKAENLAGQGEWVQAIVEYEQVLQKLPPEEVDGTRRVRLAKSRAQMFGGHLPEANQDLESLLNELMQDKKTDPEFADEVRAALANSQYYMTWLLRLEGEPEEEWSPYIEGARQNYRTLAESAAQKGDPTLAKRMEEDLDSSIRLARMDLSELQGLPLPSQ